MSKDIIDADLLARVAAFLASGKNPNGYYVSAAKLRDVINATTDADTTMKAHVLAQLETKGVLTGEYVDSLQLGMAFGEMSRGVRDEGFDAIVADIKNRDKLPFVIIEGKLVH